MDWWIVSMIAVIAFLFGVFACPVIAMFLLDEKDDDDDL